MPADPTPREMAKSLLQGVAPPRPLFLPIVFSLGARVENVPLRAFLRNPAKIFNSLRRVRAHLHADGVACYFDPFLEIEALGATLDWDLPESPGLTPRVRWPQPLEKGTLAAGLAAPADAVRRARVPVAIDVIRRLNAVLRDGSLLMAGLTGPFTLAARLAALEAEPGLRFVDVPREALDLASSFLTLLATAYAEGGANLIFLQEETLPAFSAENFEDFASYLAPTLNVIRFYQSLPVLYFSRRALTPENREFIFQRPWDAVLCLPLDAFTARAGEASPIAASSPLSLALPLEAFHASDSAQSPEGDLRDSLRQAVTNARPAILTTAGDVPASTDMKHLLKVLGEIPRAY